MRFAMSFGSVASSFPLLSPFPRSLLCLLFILNILCLLCLFCLFCLYALVPLLRLYTIYLSKKASSEAFSFTPFIFKFSVFGFPVSFFSVPFFRFLNFRSTSSVPSTYRRSLLPFLLLDRKFAFTGQIDVQLPENLQGTFGQHHRRMGFASGKFG